MLILSTHNSEGMTGRCDAKCHEAKEPECRCCCGGKYHGKGTKQVLEMLKKDLDNWLGKGDIQIEVRQDLFGEIQPKEQ